MTRKSDEPNESGAVGSPQGDRVASPFSPSEMIEAVESAKTFLDPDNMRRVTRAEHEVIARALLSLQSVREEMEQDRRLIHLLQALATGSEAKKNRHDVIFLAAAERIRSLSSPAVKP